MRLLGKACARAESERAAAGRPMSTRGRSSDARHRADAFVSTRRASPGELPLCNEKVKPPAVLGVVDEATKRRSAQ